MPHKIGKKVYVGQALFNHAQGCADGGHGGILSNLQKSWSKRRSCCKRVSQSISCDLFLSNNS